ncbi:hypothetical protein ACPPVS_07395 [Cellulomonas sp. McL0617]|uniref:hypothetical protein n=1 Tax=Cellulomonas sp. McL0617 TaxID=3415675 RepID=UPI003CEB70CE
MAPQDPIVGWPAEPEQPAPRARRRPRTAVVVLSAVLVLVLVGTGLVLARMLATTRAWQESSAGWERLATQGATDLASTQGDLATAQSELDTTTAQLATAQTRITDLANEKAQLGDTNATQQELADYQARVSQAAGQVATALAACITGQQKLIGYLQESQKYDTAQLTQFGQDVATVCSQATAANTALQAELKR